MRLTVFIVMGSRLHMLQSRGFSGINARPLCDPAGNAPQASTGFGLAATFARVHPRGASGRLDPRSQVTSSAPAGFLFPAAVFPDSIPANSDIARQKAGAQERDAFQVVSGCPCATAGRSRQVPAPCACFQRCRHRGRKAQSGAMPATSRTASARERTETCANTPHGRVSASARSSRTNHAVADPAHARISPE